MTKHDGRTTLNVGWSNCERSTTWLTDYEDNHYALINIGGSIRLEVYIQAENDTYLHVGLIDRDDAGCAAHIHSCCDGWHASECNIPGINIDTDGTVIGNHEDE